MAGLGSITDIYLWFFLSSLFFAFGLRSLSAMIMEKIRKEKLWSRHLPAFYIFSALEIAVITMSVFFTDWSSVPWSCRMVIFYAVSALFWFIVIKYPLFPGLPVLLISLGAVLYFNHTVSSMCRADSDPRIAYIRMLSDTIDERTFEFTDCSGNTVFIKGEGRNPELSFDVIEIPDYLFFIPGRVYIFGNLTDAAEDKVIKWFSDRNLILKIKEKKYTLQSLLLLRQYVLTFNKGSKEFKLELAD